MERFKPRFSLAMLMLAVTITAFLLWAVPAYRDFQIRSEFESAARQLKVGITPSLFKILPPYWLQGRYDGKFLVDTTNNKVEAIAINYDRYWYCIYAHSEDLSQEELRSEREREEKRFRADRADGDSYISSTSPATTRWTKIFVYRLEPMPEKYSAQTEAGKKQKLPKDQYFYDFYEVLTGREPSTLGIEYELVHSDPSEVPNE
jgi:hypothetical protein